VCRGRTDVSPAGVTHGGGGAADLAPILLPGGGGRALLLLPGGGDRLAGGGGRLAGGVACWPVAAALDSVSAGAALSTTTILMAALPMAGSSLLRLAWLLPDAAGVAAAPFPLGLASPARREGLGSRAARVGCDTQPPQQRPAK
jgi:hypothetical protein